MLIQLEGISLSFGPDPLLKDLSLSISEGDRVGLVGSNGCGKSTVLRVLLGQQDVDAGQVTSKRGLIVGYMPQEVAEHELSKTARDFLLEAIPERQREDEYWRADVALGEIELEADAHDRPISTLSGGWRRLLMAARAAINEPDLLILDEPTNHLDLGKILRFEAWLLAQRAATLVVSHDRQLLERCVNKTMFLRHDGLHVFSAPFGLAREELVRIDTGKARAQAKEEAEIARLEAVAKRLMIWANLGGSNKMAKKSKAIQHRADRMTEQKTDAFKDRRREINLSQNQLRAKSLVSVNDHQVTAPGGRHLFEIEKFFLRRGDRVCLLGLNGLGKSVFVRRLVKAIHENAGVAQDGILVNPQVKLGYVDQQLEGLPEDQLVPDFLQDRFDLDNTRVVSELHAIGFPQREQKKKIGELSHGERSRLTFLCLKLMRPNLLILDEPSNHLDIAGQERLEELLSDPALTCLLVTHDRTLLQSVPNRHVEIRNGELVEEDGAEDFLERVRMEEMGD
ncbi:MAG: ABC-F family ATP-binding cassette domain-containing protein [Acidobacteriota bacterium]